MYSKDCTCDDCALIRKLRRDAVDAAQDLAFKIASGYSSETMHECAREGEDFYAQCDVLFGDLLDAEQCEDIDAAELSDIARDALYDAIVARGIDFD